MAKVKRDPVENKLILWSLFWTLQHASSGNVAKMHAHGFCAALMPWLKYLYKEKHPEEFKAAMVRHTVFYNTNFTMNPFIVGLVIAMEKERERTLGTDQELSEDLISSTKISLQGTLAGLGDALMFNTIRVIAAGASMSLCLAGSIMGPLLFITIQWGTQIAMRYYLIFLGYDIGLPFLESVVSGGIVTAVSNAASIVGLIMVGAMVPSNVRFPIRMVVQMGDFALPIQSVLDEIMPNMLPLALLIVTVLLLKRRWKITSVIFLYMGLCVALGIVGIL